MLRNFFRLVCLGILGLGLYVQWGGPSEASQASAISQSAALENFEIDISEQIELLGELRAEERGQQIADWVVHGTLLSSGLPESLLRDALYDQSPLRLPFLEESHSFDYSRGRHVVLPGGEAWLFIRAEEANPKIALGRLADQARLAMSEIPRRVRIHIYSTDPSAGVIRVQRAKSIDGSVLFSAEYGYAEKTVDSVDDLGSLLGQIDDVVYVGTGGDKLRIGGRKLSMDFPLRIALEDVAALYKAHKGLEIQKKEFESQLRNAADPVLKSFNDLVDILNTAGRSGRLSGLGTWRASYKLERDRLLSLLGKAPRGSRRQLAPPTGERRGLFGLSEVPEPPELLGLADFSLTLDAASSELESLRTEVDRFIERRMAETAAGQKPVPQYPGFSLDPQWDTQGLRQDLQLLLQRPMALHEAALATIAGSKQRGGNDAAKPRVVWAAQDVVESRSGPPVSQIRTEYQPLVRTIINNLDNSRKVESGDSPIIDFYKLRNKLREDRERILEQGGNVLAKAGLSDETKAILRGLMISGNKRYQEIDYIVDLLKFIAARQESQCARYDGELKGTQVGMNLFYTDLLAKVWSSVDWNRSAPAKDIPGLMVEPREAQYLESAYKEEELRLTSTRVWFAPKEGTFVLEQNQILFAPIATRVYAAGSNPIDPRKESVPAESSRRVLNWWDRHFEALADYEPHFHRQNEVMKWSVITGWLREHERLGGLADVAVDSSQRFDRWFKSAPGLRFRDDVRFLPESRWLGETECMERLRSYPFEHVNSVAYIEGGVSLGSTELLAAARRVDSTVPVTLRRGSVNYAKSAAGDLVTFKGTTFHVPSSQSVARAEIAATSRLRQAGSELRLSQLETRVTPGWFSVHSEHGSVAGLRVSNTGRGIKLHTDLGALEQVRQSLISQGRGEGAPLSTVSAKLSVEPRTYVIEGAEGRQMLKAVTTADGHDAWVHVQEAAEVGRREGLWVPGDQRGGKLLQTVGQHTAEAKLAEQRWLRVSPQEGSEVGYTFTQQGPSEGSRSVLLKTDSPALRSVEGKLGSDGQLYLQRPSNLPPEGQRAFNNLGRSEQLTAAELRALDKTRGDGPVVLEPLSARRSLPEQVQTWAERGDVAQIKRAIADRVRQGRGAEALDLLKRLNKESLNAGAGDLLTLSQSRSRAVSKILAAHGGPPAPGLSKLRVATMGRRSLAAAELAREARSYVADGKDLPELAGQGSTVVMFQRQLLNQGSLYENPAGYLASVSRNPRVVVTEVRPGQLGSFTPDMVVVQEKEFVRQPVSARPTSSSQGGNGYLRWSRSSTPSQPRVLLVEECPDPNHDGQLDSEERQSCLCDLNKDGTLTTEERASCGLPPQ